VPCRAFRPEGDIAQVVGKGISTVQVRKLSVKPRTR
jgi:hypothetical protein